MCLDTEARARASLEVLQASAKAARQTWLALKQQQKELQAALVTAHGGLVASEASPSPVGQ
jgi:predicted component of type VI protein secretion system